MNPLTKKNLLLAGLAFTLGSGQLTARAAATTNAAAMFSDSVVATGKGFEIKRSQLDEAFISYNASLAANGGSVPEDKRAEVRDKLLEHLIMTRILTQRATADDKAKTREMVEQNIATARKSAPSPEAFDAQIKASGMTIDQVRQRANEEQVCQRVWRREITNNIVISEAAAKKFYDDNPSKFEQPEEVRAAHVLISTEDPISHRPLPADEKKQKEKLAKDVRARAEKGEDFGKLAKQYSDDPGSKDKGGEYTFPRGQMVPEFEAAAFSLKTNQVSDLVETKYGYHIIKLLAKLPPKHETFAEVEPKIKEYLMEREAEGAMPAYLKKLKADYNVVIVGDKPASSSTVKKPAS